MGDTISPSETSFCAYCSCNYIAKNDLTDMPATKDKHKSTAIMYVHSEEPTNPLIHYNSRPIVKPITTLKHISRSPLYCPESLCAKLIAYSGVMSHLFTDHSNIEYLEAFTDKPIILDIMFDNVAFSEYVCAALLLYSGADAKTCPGKIGVSVPNTFLVCSKVIYENHFPIMVMVSKQHQSILYRHSTFPSTKSHTLGEDDVVFIWLVAPNILKTLTATVTIISPNWMIVTTKLLTLRNIRESQDPQEFVQLHDDYIMLKSSDLEVLRIGPEHEIILEIEIHEAPLISAA